jgi:hypothetical protein
MKSRARRFTEFSGRLGRLKSKGLWGFVFA